MESREKQISSKLKRTEELTPVEKNRSLRGHVLEGTLIM